MEVQQYTILLHYVTYSKMSFSKHMSSLNSFTGEVLHHVNNADFTNNLLMSFHKGKVREALLCGRISEPSLKAAKLGEGTL